MNPRIEEKDGVFTIVMRWDLNEHLRWMIDPDAPWIWLPSYEDRSLHRPQAIPRVGAIYKMKSLRLHLRPARRTENNRLKRVS